MNMALVRERKFRQNAKGGKLPARGANRSSWLIALHGDCGSDGLPGPVRVARPMLAEGLMCIL